ncbi:MAG: protein-disulfide reductase DsbD N-terminal domain-containing protein [Betaproteobacteria bacterium]|nr:protein-disulfide reductase DsbD N-terminal domain-containing protein [Betaproteobacteria bacterium]
MLDAEQAFTMTARLRDADTIELNYRIAPKTYLYRKRFKFEIATPGWRLKTSKFPAGKMKQDATFGYVEIYRDSVRILLPISPVPAAQTADPPRFELRATSQGCADVGICYPPQTHRLRLQTGMTEIVAPEPAATLPFSSPPKTGPPLGR